MEENQEKSRDFAGYHGGLIVEQQKKVISFLYGNSA